MEGLRFEIQSSWDGGPLLEGESARVVARVDRASQRLIVRIEASYHGDAVPKARAGSLPGLWNHEVVELFLLGEDDRYLELEFGPHGHYLGLTFHGQRQVVEQGFPLDYEAARQGDRWTATARIPLDRLPQGLVAANACSIHGSGASRRHLVMAPVPGPRPDFHRLDCFLPLSIEDLIR